MADQTPDPWAELLNGWCGKPWEPVDRGSLRWCPHCDTSAMAHRIGVARDAERQQHQQENGRLRALMLVDEDRIVEQAKTLRQQAEQIETLTQALKGVKSIQRGYLCWCDGSWNNVEHGHQPKCQKATEAISGASRPTEGEQGAKHVD